MCNFEFRREVVVTLTCTNERISETDVEIINIEEDIQGRDLLTFICPKCKKQHTAYRLG